MSKYNELNRQELSNVYKMQELGYSIREIGRKLERSASTIWRILKKNYSVELARAECPYKKGRLCDEMRRRRRSLSRKRYRLRGVEMREYVEERLREGWSPELISGRMKLECKFYVCMETIYQWIYRERRELIRYLEVRSGDRRNKRSGGRRWRKVCGAASKTSIHSRPREANERLEFGHVEVDCIVSKHNKVALFCAVDRHSRHLNISRIEDQTGDSGYQAMKSMIRNSPYKIKTITCDNGSENSLHAEIKRSTNVECYFADPYASWQKGGVERINRSIRRFFPKGKDLEPLNYNEIKRVENILKNRPRKVLNFRTPSEVLRDYLSKSSFHKESLVI